MATPGADRRDVFGLPSLVQMPPLTLASSPPSSDEKVVYEKAAHQEEGYSDEPFNLNQNLSAK